MMGKIYWVDDDFTQMLYIIQGGIAKLWRLKQTENESVQSNIIIFGYLKDHFVFKRLDA